MSEREQLEQAMAHLGTQRAVLGDAVVDVALAALEQRLAALPAPAARQPQWREVTVLSADFSGFTAWSESLDPEEVTGLVNTLWARLDPIILAQGGTVDVHLGDGLVALWGLPTARVDDAERAIQAALAIQEELRSWGGGWVGAPLQMRIGVHTGLALLGNGGQAGHFAAGGDAVQAAARLQEAAPPGMVLISQDLHDQLAVTCAVPYEPEAAAAERMPAYLVVSAPVLDLDSVPTWLACRAFSQERWPAASR